MTPPALGMAADATLPTAVMVSAAVQAAMTGRDFAFWMMDLVLTILRMTSSSCCGFGWTGLKAAWP
jgi:hypothetical protein